MKLINYNDPEYPYQQDYGPRWMNDDGHHVGCHPRTTKPLGTPADDETRQARMLAHQQFDKLWRGPDKKMSRRQAYRLVSQHMGKETHIGQSDTKDCNKIIEWAIKEQQK